MMKKVRVREKICAIMMAVLMILSSVLPSVPAMAQVTAPHKDIAGNTVYLFVYETYTDEQGQLQKLPVSGARVRGQFYLSDGTEVPEEVSGQTDVNGMVSVNCSAGTLDSDAKFKYQVEKTGYSTRENIELAASDFGTEQMPAQCAVTMSDIELGWQEKGEGQALNVVAGGAPVILEILNTIADENIPDEAYVWECENPELITISDVQDTPADQSGTPDQITVKKAITGVKSGETRIKVYRYGKEAYVNVKVEESLSDNESQTGDDTDSGEVETPGSDDEPADKAEVEITIIGASEITYGDPAPEITVQENTDTGREISYSIETLESASGDVASIDSATGVITVTGAGKVKITATAHENEVYASASDTHELVIYKKSITIGRDQAEKFVWSTGQYGAVKVYDGDAGFEIQGTLSGSEDGIVGNDQITLSVTADVASSDEKKPGDAGVYNGVKISSVLSSENMEEENPNYQITIGKDFADTSILPDTTFEIKKRPLYVEPADDITFQYGQDVNVALQESGEVKLAGENGSIDDSQDQGLIEGEALPEYVKDYVDFVFAGEYASPSDAPQYVGSYPNAVMLKRNETECPGNYEICVDESVPTLVDLKITAQKISDDELWEALEIDEENSCSYSADSEDTIWVSAAGGKLAFKIKEESELSQLYDEVWLKTGDGSFNTYLEYSADSESAVIESEISVYLSCSRDEDDSPTRTASSDGEGYNKIPAGEIKFDNNAPSIVFTGEDHIPYKIYKEGLFQFGNFSYFTNKAYHEFVTITDGESGLADQQCHLLQVQKGENVTKAITQAVNGFNEWDKLELSGKGEAVISVPETEEGGYYVILVRAEDRTGNHVVYASNGLVIEKCNPKVNLTVKSKPNGENGWYNDDIDYDLTVKDFNDPHSEIYSGIKEVEVTVRVYGTDPEIYEELESGGVEDEIYVNSFKLTKEQIDDIAIPQHDGNGYTFDDLKNKRELSIKGKIRIPGTSGNKVEIIARVMDEAGNEGKAASELLQVDNVDPQMEWEWDVTNEDNVYQTRTATVTFTEQNFNPELVWLDVYQNGSYLSQYTLEELEEGVLEGVTAEQLSDTAENSSSSFKNGDRQIIYKITFLNETKSDVHYRVIPRIQDEADNWEYGEEHSFTIDNKPPTVLVKYDDEEQGNLPNNGKYFKAERTMPLTFIERNYSEELAGLELNVEGDAGENGEEQQRRISLAELLDTPSKGTQYGIAITKAVSDNTSETNEEHKYEITFGEDGKEFDYHVVPYIIDQADNENENVEYAEGSNPDTQADFAVDMKAPVLNVSYYILSDDEGIMSPDDENITTEIDASADDEDSRVYKNKKIYAKIEIEERNFSSREGGFGDGQMEAVMEAVDAADNPVTAESSEDDAAAALKGLINNPGEWDSSLDGENTHVLSLEFSADANYTFGLDYEDLAGNPMVLGENQAFSGEGSGDYGLRYFTVDTEAPEGTISIENETDFQTVLLKVLDIITFGVFHQEKTNIVFSSDDQTSPHKQSYYLYDPQSEGEHQLTEEELKKRFLEEGIESAGFSEEGQEQTHSAEANTQQIPYLRVEDMAGNVEYYTGEGLVVDNVKPDITIELLDSEGNAADANMIFSGDVPFRILTEDPLGEETGAYSGIQCVQYEIFMDGNRTAKAEYTVSGSNKGADFRQQSVLWDKNGEEPLMISAGDNNSNNVVIRVTAEDNAGNPETTELPLKIDTTPPEISVEYDNHDVRNGRYFKDDRVMTVTYKERNFDEAGLTFDILGEDGTWEEGVTLPELKEMDGFEFEAECEDNQAEIPEAERTDEREIVYRIRFSGGESGDKDYGIRLHARDMADNSDEGVNYDEEQASEEFTVDKVRPQLKVVYKAGEQEITPGLKEEDTYYEREEEITVVVSISERNFCQEDEFAPEQIQLDLTATDAAGKDVLSDVVSAYKDAVLDTDRWKHAVSAESTDTKEQIFAFGEDANYSFSFDYEDLAGNRAVEAEESEDSSPDEPESMVHKCRYFTVDKTAPAGSIQIESNIWRQFVDMITFGIFTNRNMTDVIISGQDDTAGIKSIQYYKFVPPVESRGTFAGLTEDRLDNLPDNVWEDGERLTLRGEQQAVIYAKIMDKAGNKTYISSAGVIVDTTKASPEIIIETAPSAYGYYSSDVPFTLRVTDPQSGGTYSGLKEVSYEILRNGQLTQAGNYANELSDRTQRRKEITKRETVSAQLNNSNNVQIRVRAVDWAGNESTATKDIRIDITAPAVSIYYDLNNPVNGRYYNAARTATVVVSERNFDESLFTFNVTNTDGTRPYISEWTHSAGNGVSDETTHTCQVVFSADGDYTFTADVSDLAGNHASYGQTDEFTIDQTTPVIEVAYDNNDQGEPGYYNAARTAVIRITEHNFNPADVSTYITAALQGTGLTAPALSEWSTQGDVHTASVSFASDADYTFDISYTDLAGNAAQDYSQDSFTVDTTMPELEIFDIADKSANNGAVAPAIQYSDINYSESGVSIVLEGTMHDAREVEGDRTAVENGARIKMADFAYTKDNDDLYTLTASVQDRAGNRVEKSIVFSVNRFGSVYVFSNATETMLNDFYSKEAQDIVVTEINVDSLVFNGISYGRDGELVNMKAGEDYTVEESGTEASWKEYRYTIHKENFEQEGHYTVTIDSEDRAENLMNNKVKDSAIEFVIDKTKPTVVITGVEDNAQYRADSRELTVDVADNIAMGGVDLYINGEDAPAEHYDADTIQQSGGKLSYMLHSDSRFQDIKAVAWDAAGNEAVTEDISILVTSNLLIQYINNLPLVIVSAFVLLLLIGLILLVIKRRKDRDEEVDNITVIR